jgi:phosphoribosylanthranilate isomerase
MRVRVKICGMTRAEDALHAARAGADAVGLVFHGASPRCVTAAQAAAIAAALPAFVSRVGLFVDADPGAVRAVLDEAALDLLQFHGEEEPDYCRSFGRPYIKTLRMADGADVEAFARRYRDARALLLDAFVPGIPGGTGRVFDWGRVPREPGLPVILAGGLTPENVGEAVRTVRPWAVDVSGGVEASPGRKDGRRVEAFLRAVRSASEA